MKTPLFILVMLMSFKDKGIAMDWCWENDRMPPRREKGLSYGYGLCYGYSIDQAYGDGQGYGNGSGSGRGGGEGYGYGDGYPDYGVGNL